MPDEALLLEVDRSQLRKEAAPFPWEQLTRDQKRAVLDCHRRFSMLATLPFQPQPKSARHGIERFLPNLYGDRRFNTQFNRVVLIDGGRGSGKSVALLRLFELWSKQIRTKKDPTQQEPKDEREFLETAARVESKEPGDRPPLIVPIGYTSASLIENSTNFFTYIATYIHQVIEAITATHGGDRPPTSGSAWTAVSDSGSVLSQFWNSFLQAVAHAADNQAQERKKLLDPEQWALELRDSEFRRRDIPELFSDLMNELVSEYATVFGGGQYPLFVVGIDDADLVHGLQLVPLLNSIRRLDHPRMSFVLTGDTDLFVQALSDGFLGRIRGPLRALDLADPDPMLDREHATRLARDIFDKVVPRNQRYKLPKLRMEERVALIEKNNAFCAIHFQAEALPQLVHDTKTHQSTEKRTLDYYFKHNPAVRAALPARLRDMVGFTEYLEGRERDVADVVQRLWRDGLERSPIEPNVQQILKPLVRRRDDGGVATLVIQTYGITREFLPGQIIPGRPLPDRWFVALGEIAGYEIKHDSFARPLPEEATAALILATDLAADNMKAAFLGRSLSPNEFDVPFVKVSYAATDLRTYDFIWPLPDWDAFVDFEIFSRLWRELLQKHDIAIDVSASGREGTSRRKYPQSIMGKIARLFLGLAIDVSDRRGSVIDAPVRDWPVLADQLNTLAQAEVKRGPYRRNRHTVEWARNHAVLLAAPESGLTSSEANKWLTEFKSTGLLNPGAAKSARQQRALRAVRRRTELSDGDELTGVPQETVPRLIDEIDKDSTGFKWKDLISSATASPAISDGINANAE